MNFANLLKGALPPKDNDSMWILDPEKRGVPNLPRMARHDDSDEVDLCIVGAGAGGATLAQRLARKGWRVVVLEAGPFWDPDRDWVSDEAGSHHIYWTMNRIIGGENPIELGKNNSGWGVGGSMTHFAGYTPRLHPSDFETQTRDGFGVDWPISYWDLKEHFNRVERELPVAGQFWPWGDPHSYPHSPHPVSKQALYAWRGARKLGIEMRVGPVAIANGVFGNRPHCIYRGYCLQGCKVNAKASPLITHVPDAIEFGAEFRANCLASKVELDESGRARGVTYIRTQDGSEHHQRAAVVAVAGYSIETPRLLLNSAQRGFPHGLCNNEDQVGRYIMVRGAPQVAGRFPDEIRQYKAPPPEVSSEQFYETDQTRGFLRGFSIQTVSPQPIAFAEHVMADGHWGAALREYVRDYNHWSTLGVLSELSPEPENRVIIAEAKDQFGLPVAQMNYTLSHNDKQNIAFATRIVTEILKEAGAQDTVTIQRYAHLVGGCRMGFTPEDSVVDADHRSWAIENLYIADGSVFPTQGSANPALAIHALASRLAERMSKKSAAAAARKIGAVAAAH